MEIGASETEQIIQNKIAQLVEEIYTYSNLETEGTPLSQINRKDDTESVKMFIKNNKTGKDVCYHGMAYLICSFCDLLFEKPLFMLAFRGGQKNRVYMCNACLRMFNDMIAVTYIDQIVEPIDHATKENTTKEQEKNIVS